MATSLQFMRNIFGDYYDVIIKADTARLLKIMHMWYSEQLPTDDRFDLIHLPIEIKADIFCNIYVEEILHDLERASCYYEIRDDDKRADYLFQICYRLMFVAKYSSFETLLQRLRNYGFNDYHVLSFDFMTVNLHVFKDYYDHHKKHIGVGGCNRMSKFLDDVYKIYTF